MGIEDSAAVENGLRAKDGVKVEERAIAVLVELILNIFYYCHN